MAGRKYNYVKAQIVFPSEEFFRKWKGISKAARMPLSRWIFETVEASLDRAEAPKPSQDITRERDNLQAENHKLRLELEMTSKLAETYRTEAFIVRNQLYQQLHPIGKDEIDERLMKLLKRGGVWHREDILREMDVNPNDVEALSTIAKQLQALQDHGLVSEGAKGWRWIG